MSVVAAVEVRRCVVCSADISDKRRHARFCGSTCRGLHRLRKPYDPPGFCETCGTRLSSTRGSYCSDACRARARRRRNGSFDRPKTFSTGAVGQAEDQPQDAPLRASRCAARAQRRFEDEDGEGALRPVREAGDVSSIRARVQPGADDRRRSA